MEFRLGMDEWENGVPHRNTGGEVERIDNLDPVSSGTYGGRESKQIQYRHTKFIFFHPSKCSGYEDW